MKKFFNELRTALFKVCPEKHFRILKLTSLLLLVTIFNVFGSETYSQLVNKETGSAESMQQQVVTGTVTDAATGETLPGVSVVIKGTTLGTLTDLNGKFTISLPESSAVLTISFIGYTAQDIRVSQGAAIRVQMVTELQQIEEVIVVGYSTQRKESVVGAITQVNNATLIKSGAVNVTNAIAGKLSGVLTIQQTGEPGANQAEIIVRGLSSWSGSAPLILIDGVERDFQDMDPNEINTISVLKDASATAVFGSKGANGVIIITTKRGYLGKPQMTFTGSSGIQVPTRDASFIDSYTTMSMMNVARMNGQQFTLLTPKSVLNEYRNPSTPLKALQYPNVNWWDMLTKDFAPAANANINVIGGTDFVKYFCSLGYLYEGTIFKQSTEEEAGYRDSRYWYNRFNFRANIDFALTNSTQVSLNVGGEVGIRNQPTQGTSGDWKSFYSATVAEFPAYFPAWVLEQIPDIDYPDATGIRRAATYMEWVTNPWSDINKGNFQRNSDTKLFTDLIFNQKLDVILKGLSTNAKVALNTYYNHQTLTSSYYIPSYRILWDRVGVDRDQDGQVDQNPWERDVKGIETFYPAPLDINVGGLSGGYYTDIYYEMALNYNNSFGKHSVTGLALINFQQKNQGTSFPYYNQANVGRVTYAYSNKYLLEINVGYTGSEQFAPGNRFGFFPSGAVGWVISEENFFKTAVPWMSKLKIRYSDGLVGSDAASNRWLYMSDYFVDSRSSIHEDLGSNLTAQWEEARKKDLGIEIGIFRNLFTFTVDLFDEYRDKMLLAPRSTTFLIGNSFKDLNLGSLKKHGIEVEFEFNKTTVNKINYFIKGNIGINENRVLFRDDPVYAPEYTKYAGKPLGAQLNGVIKTGTGYHTSINDIHINPAPLSVQNLHVGDYKFLDYNSDGAITNKDSYPIKGQEYSPVVYSLSSGISYKGFDFNVMLQGNQGKYMTMSIISEVEFFYGSPRVHLSQLDYWRPDNQDATHSTLRYSGSDGGPAIYTWGSNAFEGNLWRNASYLRLKEVYAAYNLTSDFLKRSIGISNMLIYANATNLFTFTKLLKEFDPEMKSFGSGWYPLLSRYNLGVKFAF